MSKLVTEITEGAAAEIRAVARRPGLSATEKLRQIAHLNALRRARQPTRFLRLARSEADLPPELVKTHEAGKRSLLRDVVRVIEEGITRGSSGPAPAENLHGLRHSCVTLLLPLKVPAHRPGDRGPRGTST